MKQFNRKTQNLRHQFLLGFFTVGLFFLLPALTFAAPGDLDLSFGNGGLVFTAGGLNTSKGMAIQPDGKIVAVGNGGIFQDRDFAVVRYNTNGSLDSSFGGSGIVIIPIGPSHDNAYSVAIQADGKIVVAGVSKRSVSDFAYDFAVVRLNPNGSLDTSFNGTGKVTTSVTGLDFATSVAIQTDGKIVVAGENQPATQMSAFVLVRYNANGSLDTTFNGTGKISTQAGGDVSGAKSVAIQADGKIVAVGYGLSAFTVVRYNPNGSLDTSFNGTGIANTSFFGNYSGARSVAIQSDGKILVAGYFNGFSLSFAFVRYNPNGSLDTSFGGTGKITYLLSNFGSDANSVAIQSDGKIVAAGYIGKATGSDFVVVRLDPNGSLDTTFNGTGKVITPVTDGYDIPYAVAIQADGKIVAAGGGSYGSAIYDFVVVRYLGGSDANIRTRFDFDGDGKADISLFRPSDRTWYLDRSTQGFSATQFGLATDKLAPADFDGDGRTDIAVFRDGTWYLLRSTAGFIAVPFGQVGDIPQPGDFDGDGRAELAVYRVGTWYTLNLTNNQFSFVPFGLSSDKPVVGDYDGDGREDRSFYRDGTWILGRSTQGLISIQFGLPSDRAVPADYDGDGKTDPAVFRDGTWYLLCSQTGFTTIQFGLASDIPAPADYDGDGKADVAVYRDGNWYWLASSNNQFHAVQFGIADDRPIPAAFVP